MTPTPPEPQRDDSPTRFKTDLRTLVRNAGFETLVDVERKTGLSHDTVSTAFNISRPMPSAKTVHAVVSLTSASPEMWERRRLVLEAASEAGTSGATPPPPGTDPDPVSRSPRSSRRTVLVVAVAVAAVAAVAVTLFVVLDQGGPGVTFTETTGGPAHTWSDYEQAGGSAGPPLGPRQSVQVSCRVKGYVVPDGDPWWYRLESKPWSGDYYATSDAFYNNGAVSGRLDNGVVVDEQVPIC